MKYSQLAAAAAILFGAAQADAALVAYNNLASFQAATTGVTTTDFDGIAAANSFVGYNNGPLTLPGVTFTSNGSMFVIDQGFYGTPYAGGGYLNSDYAGVNEVTATLGSAATAIAMDFGSLLGSASVTFTFLFSDGSTYSESTTQGIGVGALDFIGFTSTVGFTSVKMSMPDGPSYNAIDNFRFGTALPEPGSLALAGLALAALTGLRRRSAAAKA